MAFEKSSDLKTEVVSVSKHSMIYLSGRIVSRAAGFFMIPIYTRFIAPTNYGAMELIGILSGVVMMIISMGVSDGMSRFYYAEKDQAKRNQVVSTVIISFSVIGIPIVVLSIWIAGFIYSIVLEESQYLYYLQIAIATVWFGLLVEISYTYLRMIYKAKLFVAISIIQLFIALSLNIWFIVFLKLDILGVFYSTLITHGMIGIVLSIAILKKVRPSVSTSMCWQLIKFGLPLVPSRIGSMLGFVSNRFFLRWFASADPTVALAQIGFYSLGHKFGDTVNRFVNAPFNSFWGPRRLDLLLSDTENAKKKVARVCTYATICSVYLSLILSSGIESLIEIIADPRYKSAHVVVPFVALTYIILGLEMHFMSGILYKRKTILSSYVSVLSIGVILAWNYIFIPSYGLLGAATSNLAGFIVRCSLVYIISQRLYPIPFELKRILILFVTGCALYAISQTLNFSSPFLTLFARTVLTALFPFVLYVVRFYTEGEIEFISQMLKKGFKVIGAFNFSVRRA